MKTKTELEQSLRDIATKINNYFEQLTDAMCDGDSYREREFQRKISHLETRKEFLEWVLQ